MMMARKKKVEDEVKELEEFEELDVEESLSSSDKQSKPEKKSPLLRISLALVLPPLKSFARLVTTR